MTRILGLDIGGTKTAVVLGDRQGRVYDREVFATRPQRGFFPTFADLCRCAEMVRGRAEQAGTPPEVVSVSIGGPLRIEPGIIQSPPNLPGWDDIPLKNLLKERFRLPIHIEHDGNAGALAEWYFGAARGLENVIFLTMGTGFGAGLILNGRLYRGTCDTAGEVGHVRIAEDGPIAFDKPGSWEGLCGGAGIAKLAALRFPKRWKVGQVSAQDIAELAQSGDGDALTLLEEVSRHLGRGLAMLIDILNPQMIVIGALVVRLGELVLGPARRELEKEALSAALYACRVVPAALGERLGDIAALCAAIQALGGPEEAEAGHSGG